MDVGLGLRSMAFNEKDNAVIAIPFSPTMNPLKLPFSICRHLKANLPQFFLGGATAYLTLDKESGMVDVLIRNVTSRSSLELHMVEDKKMILFCQTKHK